MRKQGSLEKPEDLIFLEEVLIRTFRAEAMILSSQQWFSSFDRDIITIKERLKDEGIGFLTKTLPSLGKCLDKALSNDSLLPSSHNFEKSKSGWGAPLFMGHFWLAIFDPSTGALRDNPDDIQSQVIAVRAVRQICYLFYKLKGAYAPDAAQEVLDQFVQTDSELPAVDDDVLLSPKAERALESARMLVWYTLRGFDPLDITPGHGPGAVATGESPWEKFSFSRLYPKLDEKYPYPDFFFYNYGHLCDELQSLEDLDDCESPCAKIALVEKDSRGPRLISMEPLEIQWIQQGLMKSLYSTIESENSPCFGYVNFTNQCINRGLALDNSFDGKLVTADMKEASDRVSHWLIRKLMPAHLIEYFEACRSPETELPCGRRVHLNKFCPMGSAVCFPLEALTFWALAVGSLVDITCMKHIKKLPPVYVYGDDLILPREDLDTIRPVFEELHLLFNEDKCCTGRFFRESCGMDAFKLNNVTPLRCKTPWSDLPSPEAAVSWIEFTNLLQEQGLTDVASYLRGQLIHRLGQIPISNRTDAIAYVFRNPDLTDADVQESLFSMFAFRENRKLQHLEVRLPVPVPPRVTREKVPAWNELWRCSNQGPLDPFGFTDRIIPWQYTVPNRIGLKLRWVAVETLLSGRLVETTTKADSHYTKNLLTLVS
jgi:hypothetical protein